MNVDELYELIEARYEPEEIVRILIDSGVMDMADLIEALEEQIWEARDEFHKDLYGCSDEDEEEEDD